MSCLRACVWSVAAVMALGTSACAGRTAGPAPSPHPMPAHNATRAPLLPEDATILPEITPETYDELLTQLRGTPVVVNFWGSWCGPCRIEAPQLAAAADRYGGQIQFLGVNLMDTRPSALGFMAASGWTYPSFFDPSPGGDVRSKLGYIGQPVTIVYDAQGNKVADRSGQMPEGWLEQQLAQLAPQPSTIAPRQP